MGIRIGLWFNPSVQMIFRLGEGCPGYCVFISSIWHRVLQDRWFADSYKASRREFAPSFDKVALETNHHVIFNLDATAGRRGGYHSMNEYGNIFLENRYTDWGNYYPYRTLRNLWQLSRYVPAEKCR